MYLISADFRFWHIAALCSARKEVCFQIRSGYRPVPPNGTNL
jgi:hypothetical protein